MSSINLVSSSFNTTFKLLQDLAYEEQELRNGTVVITGKKVKRLNLVLDCLSPNDFCPHSHNYVNLQQYVIKEKKLTEQESLWIFREIVSVVNSLHQVDIMFLILSSRISLLK